MDWLLTIYYFICFSIHSLRIHDIKNCCFSIFVHYIVQTSTTVLIQAVSTEEHAVMEWTRSHVVVQLALLVTSVKPVRLCFSVFYKWENNNVVLLSVICQLSAVDS